MIYAQIKDGLIENAIVVNENTPIELFSNGWDAFIRIDVIFPTPGVGWKYDGTAFSPPIEQEES